LQRTYIINSSLPPQICEGNRRDRSVVIHATKKKEFSKQKIQIIFLVVKNYFDNE
jgi:hypothetical protein